MILNMIYYLSRLDLFNKPNVDTDKRIIRQFKLLVHEKPRINFSLKLPRHNFTRIWNKIDKQIRNVIHRSKFLNKCCVFST